MLAMTALPPPLTTPDCNIRDFGFMPLEVTRFRQSNLVNTGDPEEVLAAILLWCEAWSNVPAASLEDDDRVLARAAGYGRAVDAWLKVKDGALRGFVKCSDGRLYHPVVAEKARAAWEGKLKQRWRSYCGAIRMHNSRNAEDQRNSPTFEHWLDHGRPEKFEASASAKPMKQTDLPLDDGHDNCTPNARARTTASDVPAAPAQQSNTSCAQQSETLRATDPHVAPEIEPKGEGERKGEGDSIPPLPPKLGFDEEGKFDRLRLMNDICNVAGVSLLQPTSISSNLKIVEEWIALGVDFEAVVLPAIERGVTNAEGKRIWSLGFFDGDIRRAHTVAKRRAPANGGTRKAAPAPPPPPPPPPLAIHDQDDERIVKLRQRLSREPYYRGLADPDMVALTLNGKGLVVTARSPDHAQRIRDRIGSDLHVFSEAFLGSPSYVVRSQ